MVVDCLKILIFNCQSLPLVASELVAGSILIAFRSQTSCEPWSKDGINGFWSSHYKKGIPCNGQINLYLGIDDHPPTWMLHDISSNIWLLLVIFGYRSHSIPLNVPFSDSGIITISGFDFLTLQTRTQLCSPIHLGSVCMPHGQKSHVMRWVVDPRKTGNIDFPFRWWARS
jgi:hypothetical protein